MAGASNPSAVVRATTLPTVRRPKRFSLMREAYKGLGGMIWNASGGKGPLPEYCLPEFLKEKK
jgi:hypothetical protein